MFPRFWMYWGYPLVKNTPISPCLRLLAAASLFANTSMPLKSSPGLTGGVSKPPSGAREGSSSSNSVELVGAGWAKVKAIRPRIMKRTVYFSCS